MNTLVKLHGHKHGQTTVDKTYYIVVSENTDIQAYLQRIHAGIMTGYYYTIAGTAPTIAPVMGFIGGLVKQKYNPEAYKAIIAPLA